MKVILTNFFDKDILGTLKRENIFSIARWSPVRGVQYKKLSFLAPESDGQAIRGLSPEKFLPEYAKVLRSNLKKITNFFCSSEVVADNLALLCWCRKGRQSDYEHIMCHRILVGWYLDEYFPTLDVVYTGDIEKEWFGDVHMSQGFKILVDILEGIKFIL